jgi:hypothetical protein
MPQFYHISGSINYNVRKPYIVHHVTIIYFITVQHDLHEYNHFHIHMEFVILYGSMERNKWYDMMWYTLYMIHDMIWYDMICYDISPSSHWDKMCITVVCEFRTKCRTRKLKKRKCLNVITRPKLKNNIKNDVNETGSGCVEWSKLPEDGDRWWALVWTEKKHQVSYWTCTLFTWEWIFATWKGLVVFR